MVHEDEALPIPAEPLVRRGGGDPGGVPHRVRRAGDARAARSRRAGADPRGRKRGRHRGDADRQAPRRHGARHLAAARTSSRAPWSTGSTSGSTPAAARFADAVAEPVNVVLDVLGGPSFAENLAVLAPRGRLVLLGFLARQQDRRRSRPDPPEAARGHRHGDADPRARGAGRAGAGVHRADAAALRPRRACGRRSGRCWSASIRWLSSPRRTGRWRGTRRSGRSWSPGDAPERRDGERQRGGRERAACRSGCGCGRSRAGGRARGEAVGPGGRHAPSRTERGICSPRSSHSRARSSRPSATPPPPAPCRSIRPQLQLRLRLLQPVHRHRHRPYRQRFALARPNARRAASQSSRVERGGAKRDGAGDGGVVGVGRLHPEPAGGEPPRRSRRPEPLGHEAQQRVQHAEVVGVGGQGVLQRGTRPGARAAAPAGDRCPGRARGACGPRRRRRRRGRSPGIAATSPMRSSW